MAMARPASGRIRRRAFCPIVLPSLAKTVRPCQSQTIRPSAHSGPNRYGAGTGTRELVISEPIGRTLAMVSTSRIVELTLPPGPYERGRYGIGLSSEPMCPVAARNGSTWVCHEDVL